MFENSKIPVWLSKLAPIEINALSFFIFVFANSEFQPLSKCIKSGLSLYSFAICVT